LSSPPPPALVPLSLHDALPISLFFLFGLHDRLGARTGLALGMECACELLCRGLDGVDGSERLMHPPEMEACRGQIRALDTVQLRSEEHTSELQSPYDLVCRLLL